MCLSPTPPGEGIVLRPPRLDRFVIPPCPAPTESGMIADSSQSLPDAWSLERRSDGAVVVRIPSRRDVSAPLPDAVFTFREGDPQWDFWQQQMIQLEAQ